MSEVVSYKCPNCGAPLSFEIDKQNWDCKFCLGKFSLGDLEQSGKEAVEETGEVHETHKERFGEDAAAYSCPSCGGRIITDKNTAATFCIYCHNPTVIASRLEAEYKPARVIPFKLEKEQVMAEMNKLLSRRPLLPKDFREYAKKGEISGLYVPFWLFSAHVDAHIAARGHRVASWSDSKYRYTKTDTYHVERAARISFHNLPADGSDKMDDRLMQALEPFDYSQMVDFSMGYLSGHFAENYDVDSKAASVPAFARIKTATDSIMRGQISGYTTTTVTAQSSSNTNVDCMYVMLPVWVLMADYNGERYTFAMNGQTGKMVGKLPLSRSRMLAWLGGITAVLSVISIIGGLLI